MDTATTSVQRLTADAALDIAADDFATRVGALVDLLQRWRRPALARTVVASLLADNSDTFRELLRDFDPPVLGKCWWVREVVEKIIATTEYRVVCRLRTDLTAGERELYLMLALQFRQRGEPPVVADHSAEATLLGLMGPEIPPGPFLDALRAEGLVTCTEEPVEGAGLQQVLAKPSRICV